MSNRTTLSRGALQSSKISGNTYQALLWLGIVFSLAFLAFRLFVRISRFRRLFVDDIVVIFAVVTLLVTAILMQITLSSMYMFLDVAHGELTVLPPRDFYDRSERFLHHLTGAQLLVFTCLWSIKISFLLFFRNLGDRVRKQKIIWWGVFVFTVATYFTLIGSYNYACTTGNLLQITVRCGSPKAIKRLRQVLRYTSAVDIITDLMIMAIPINILWKVRINIRQKLALGGIFSLTIIIIVISLIRFTITKNSKRGLPDPSWLFLWSYIEAAVAIIVACLASFRALFTKQADRPSKRKKYSFHKRSPTPSPKNLSGATSESSKTLPVPRTISLDGRTVQHSTVIHAVGTPPPLFQSTTRTCASFSSSVTTAASSSSMRQQLQQHILMAPNKVHIREDVRVVQNDDMEALESRFNTSFEVPRFTVSSRDGEEQEEEEKDDEEKGQMDDEMEGQMDDEYEGQKDNEYEGKNKDDERVIASPV